ncbi:hypothetical protein A2U01_0042142, partial [Trifolium medium]|nr:hypothetical protein [Trifolium medium]
VVRALRRLVRFGLYVFCDSRVAQEGMAQRAGL